jgi:ATP-dependent helicase/nuclease subunit A
VSLSAYRDWQAAQARAIEAGSQPEHRVFVASLAVEGPPREAIPFEIVTVARPARKAAGRRFGTLVHNVMRDVPLDADRAAIQRLVDWNTRLLGSPGEERAAAAAAVESALAHPLLHRARVAGRCYREYPLVLKLDDGRMLEGVLDLAFVENNQWVIVDFKTDANTSERRLQYERQLQWYGFALLELTKMPVRACLLQI